ncbi:MULTISPECIES: DAK2 domain-containing protein [unclassified Cryobacterium]|uniref:DAK2 domain-containing protein n=1 Tax=unclassified Cryobacterium TaxID=2649013 RepID=UPI000CE53788|nr:MULTISPECIES: DAK2 domain-containing protein [unclassified Cryobacterium]
MNTPELKTAIADGLARLSTHADELRDLDAALGDGDLGITVSSGSQAVIDALGQLDDSVSPSEVAKACAKAFANANPSTMAALVAGGLLAGSKVWSGKTTIDLTDSIDFAQAAADSISTRGKSQRGDKTILDALMPAIDALRTAPTTDTALSAAIAAAEKGVEDTKGVQSRRGRAAWLQERSIGLADPGATAFLRFLQEWKTR